MKALEIFLLKSYKDGKRRKVEILWDVEEHMFFKKV